MTLIQAGANFNRQITTNPKPNTPAPKVQQKTKKFEFSDKGSKHQSVRMNPSLPTVLQILKHIVSRNQQDSLIYVMLESGKMDYEEALGNTLGSTMV